MPRGERARRAATLAERRRGHQVDLFDGLAGELVVDNFAGGGGASTGIEAALGRPVDIAINHWPEAIAVHTANHPATQHFVEDVFHVDPREICAGRPVGLAWFSPDCTHHSKAKGGKPRSKKIRGLAWVAVRWAREVRPRVIVIENVEEFLAWGPLDRDGHPIKGRAGETFRAWRRKLESYGYVVDHRLLVAADFGAPTTRRRLFVVARRDGAPISWPVPTHGPGRARPWRIAAEVIDWSLPTPSIFTRSRPLAPATLRRIAEGVRRYVFEAARPFVVKFYGTCTATDIGAPLHTVTAGGGKFALAVPTLIQTGYGEREGQTPRVPGLDKPLGTVVAGGAKHALVAAFLTKHYGGVVGHGLERPIGTVTTQDHHALTTAALAPVADCRADVGAFLRAHGIEPRPIRIGRERYLIGDIGSRMLAPRELARAQGFPEDYVIERGAGGSPLTKTDQIALVGNSVCPPLAEAIVRANVRHPAEAAA
ncbi:DNA cytosine methyltransferase [Sandaracinus amylolyticus]|uniref:DNA (cytosine-5-)-methyltransferase n=1 Tax=Sandaracinus amylolyticus TaxID=927083 RepID=A0A0F6W6R3_9BACT|nr:DNA cytosine methyltransferase [Sandaracinus amylolyticus]AKF08848.1 C-5 cytosine-specific DNA methylase [Sandaracinus amylolyticus]